MSPEILYDFITMSPEIAIRLYHTSCLVTEARISRSPLALVPFIDISVDANWIADKPRLPRCEVKWASLMSSLYQSYADIYRFSSRFASTRGTYPVLVSVRVFATGILYQMTQLDLMHFFGRMIHGYPSFW